LPAGGSNAATFSPLPAPEPSTSVGSDVADFSAAPNAAIPPAGSAGGNQAQTTPANVRSPLGRPTQCEPFRATILTKLDQRLSAQRIWQDLVAEHGFTGSYDSVKRFVRKLGAATPLPFRRLECMAGAEAQVDFGTGAPVIGADGKRRKTHVFRIVLIHSRKAYSEATFTQTTDDFLGALENAFGHFGGVPQTLVIDNLKAAVAHPDHPSGGARFDPVLTPKIQSFFQPYGTVILPTKPRMPRHKGRSGRGGMHAWSASSTAAGNRLRSKCGMSKGGSAPTASLGATLRPRRTAVRVDPLGDLALWWLEPASSGLPAAARASTSPARGLESKRTVK
jgi:transposase